MIRAYNRANERFYKRAPTTQGTGLVVTRDARRFKDLFKYSLRKKEEEKAVPDEGEKTEQGTR